MKCVGRPVVSDSLQPHGLQPTRLLCPWGFSRQEYWSRLPFPSPGNLPQSGIEPASHMSPALAGRFFFLPLAPPEKPKKIERSLWVGPHQVSCAPSPVLQVRFPGKQTLHRAQGAGCLCLWHQCQWEGSNLGPAGEKTASQNPPVLGANWPDICIIIISHKTWATLGGV